MFAIGSFYAFGVLLGTNFHGYDSDIFVSDTLRSG